MNRIAIDPGATGAIAFIDNEGNIQIEKMPEDYTGIVDRIRSLSVELNHPSCLLEKVGTHREGNSAGSSAKFARHCGQLETALYAFGISTVQVTPAKWMRKLGALPKDKKERKNQIWHLMKVRYPYLTVHKYAADAVALLSVHDEFVK